MAHEVQTVPREMVRRREENGRGKGKGKMRLKGNTLLAR
jgi:hypothetical protein